MQASFQINFRKTGSVSDEEGRLAHGGPHPAEEAECNPGMPPGLPQGCIPAGPQQLIAIDSAVASILRNRS
ncbi:hypothetical protein PoB_001394500 [Plakobranchus ocellatus]|uniref:Uncharacterized protein n=1 Tax=Plakobranchus ocellatus TaxID=259542 RepID=A0AAV3YW51_9GAST|nr:hypothetical protein PoB_001394500 [Plakobranchus ocellatus]